MELVDRYLNAVKFWLPRAQQDDIITELSEDVRSQIEEREAELGRKLNEAEVGGILKQLGRPLLVANRYLPPQHLIGPILFPIYQFVLKIVMVCYLVPWVLVWIGLMIFNPAYRAEHSGAALLGTLASFWSSFWLTAFISVGVVTLVFAVLERVQAKTGFVDEWNPHKLPPMRDPNRIPRSCSVLELVGGVVFMTWWLNVTWSQTVLEFSQLKITLVPVWRYFWWGFLLVSAVNVAVSGVNLFRPYWTRIRASMRLAADGVGSGTGLLVAQVGHLGTNQLSESIVGKSTGNHRRDQPMDVAGVPSRCRYRHGDRPG